MTDLATQTTETEPKMIEETDKEISDCMDLLNPVSSLRLRSMMLQIVEELKIKRTNDIENEERIKLLVQEKYELERRHDVEMKQFCGLEEQHRKELQDIRRQHKEEICSLKEEAKQHQVYRDCGEKEVKMLKDDVRSLQLAKYALEKRIREQDGKLHLQTGSVEQHLKQITSVEQKFTSLNKQFIQIKESEERLQKNVHEAVRLNKLLMYVNEHQKCIVERYKSDSSKQQQRIIELSTKLQSKDTELNIVEYEHNVAHLKQKIEVVNDQKNAREQELTEIRESNTMLQQKLEDSYKLIKSHLDNVEKYKCSIADQEREYDQLQEQLQDLTSKYNNVTKNLEDQTELHDLRMKDLQQQEATYQKKIKELQASLESAEKIKGELEELNSDWAKKNMELSEKVTEMQVILSVEKTDSFVQTGLSMLTMIDGVCQTSLLVNNQDIQTDGIVCSAVYTQTKVLACENNSSQTEKIVSLDQSSETDQMDGVKQCTMLDRCIAADFTYKMSRNVQPHDAAIQTMAPDQIGDVNEEIIGTNNVSEPGFSYCKENIRDKNSAETGTEVYNNNESLASVCFSDECCEKNITQSSGRLELKEMRSLENDVPKDVTLSNVNLEDSCMIGSTVNTVPERKKCDGNVETDSPRDNSSANEDQSAEHQSCSSYTKETISSKDKLVETPVCSSSYTRETNCSKDNLVERPVCSSSYTRETDCSKDKLVESPVCSSYTPETNCCKDKLVEASVCSSSYTRETNSCKGIQEKKSVDQLSPYSRYSALYKFSLNKLLGHETSPLHLKKQTVASELSVDQPSKTSFCSLQSAGHLKPSTNELDSVSSSVASNHKSSTDSEGTCVSRHNRDRLSLHSSTNSPFPQKTLPSAVTSVFSHPAAKAKNRKDPVVTVKSKGILKDPVQKKQKTDRAVRFSENIQTSNEDQSLFSDGEDDWMDEKNQSNKKDAVLSEPKTGKKRKLYNVSESYLT